MLEMVTYNYYFLTKLLGAPVCQRHGCLVVTQMYSELDLKLGGPNSVLVGVALCSYLLSQCLCTPRSIKVN